MVIHKGKVLGFGNKCIFLDEKSCDFDLVYWFFRWDNGETEKMSPWDLEPIDEDSELYKNIRSLPQSSHLVFSFTQIHITKLRLEGKIVWTCYDHACKAHGI